MTTETRHRELRAHGRRLTGTVMQYGDTAVIPGVGAERFASFSFAAYLQSGAETRVNLQHESDLVVASTRPGDRGDLYLLDGPHELAMLAELPAGDAYDSVLGMVGDGITNGLSVEFRALNERRTANTRTILKATLPALGIVDEPAYPASEVGLRAVKGRGIAGSIPYGKPLTIADRGQRRKRSYGRGAFSYNLERWTGLQADLAAAIQDAVADEVAKAREAVAQTPDVLLLRGRRTNGAVASMKAGSVVFRDTPDALTFEAPDVGETEEGRRLLEDVASGALNMGAEPIYTLPPADVVPDAVTVAPEDPADPDGVQVETVQTAALHSVAIVSRRPLGEGGDVEVRRRIVRPVRRRRFWL